MTCGTCLLASVRSHWKLDKWQTKARPCNKITIALRLAGRHALKDQRVAWTGHPSSVFNENCLFSTSRETRSVVKRRSPRSTVRTQKTITAAISTPISCCRRALPGQTHISSRSIKPRHTLRPNKHGRVLSFRGRPSSVLGLAR